MRKREQPRPADHAQGVRVAIVASDYHGDIHARLLAGARQAFAAAGGREADLHVAMVDGVYDLPPVVAKAFDAGFDAVVALGCVVRGETSHDRHISDAVFAQLSAIAVAARRPLGLGILTVESAKQARARAGGSKGDAGAFAMGAALRALEAMKSMPGKRA
jgi:6,7-dimethyl-8-ribityllumazine synthase